MNKAHIVTITSEVTNSAVHLRTGHINWQYFIGINDKAQEGVYVWQADGSRATYTNWASGQPNADGDCGVFDASDGTWSMVDCGTTGPGVLCQIRSMCMANIHCPAGNVCHNTRCVAACNTTLDCAGDYDVCIAGGCMAVIDGCPPGWYPDTDFGCVKPVIVAVESAVTWSGAIEHCYSQWPSQYPGGSNFGHLAKIGSADVNAAIHNATGREESAWWIGLNDLEQPGTFKWVSDNSTVSYFNWGSGQPSSDSNCGFFDDYDGTWYTILSCDEELTKMICQINAVCEADRNCPADLVCIDGQCVVPPPPQCTFTTRDVTPDNDISCTTDVAVLAEIAVTMANCSVNTLNLTAMVTSVSSVLNVAECAVELSFLSVEPESSPKRRQLLQQNHVLSFNLIIFVANQTEGEAFASNMKSAVELAMLLALIEEQAGDVISVNATLTLLQLVSVTSDPHFVTPRGSKFDFNGVAGFTYCIVTDQHLQVNARFVGAAESALTVAHTDASNGKPDTRTWMDQVAILHGSDVVLVEAASPPATPYTRSYGVVRVNGE
eukprot:jgi/Mesvir1/10182/Mv05157-RA.1